jgi:hypothetical protein
MKIYLTTIKNKKTKKFLNSIDRPILQAKMRRKDDIYLIDDIIHKAILHLNY